MALPDSEAVGPAEADHELGWLLQAVEDARVAGDHRRGVELSERVVALARRHDDKAALRQGLAQLALHLVRVNEERVAVEVGSEALDLLQEADDPRALAELHCTLSLAHNHLQQVAESVRHASEALRLCRLTGDRRVECWALTRLGGAYQAMYDFDSAIAYDRQAVALAREHGGDEERFACLYNLANTLGFHIDSRATADPVRADSIEEAIDVAAEASMLARNSGNSHRVVMSATREASLLVSAGAFDRAAELTAATRRIAVEEGFTSLVHVCDFTHAQLTYARGDLGTAIEALEQLIASPLPVDSTAILLDVHELLHTCLAETGEFERALHHHREYHALKLHNVEQALNVQARVVANQIAVDEARGLADRERIRADELLRAAHHDALTGLFNRRAVEFRVRELTSPSTGSDAPLCVAILDVDHFKSVNDRFGHGVGDSVLIAAADIVRSLSRSVDVAARIGGDELLIVFEASLEHSTDALDRMRAAIERHDWTSVADGLSITASGGISALDPPEPWTDAFARADAALYAAKRAGRNRVITAGHVASQPLPT